jgi:CRISPR-associated endonuclease/helicase Cas3
MGTLLAKSGANAPDLERHTRDVMDAAEAMFGTADRRTRMGECWQRFFRIPEVPWATFHGNLIAACGLHDLGKANDGFQAAMLRRGEQAIRHEHLSTLLIAQPACWAWLGQRKDEGLDREVVLSAVLTHHLKAAFDESKLHAFATPMNAARKFQSLHAEPEFGRLVDVIARRIGLNGPLDVSRVPGRWVFDGPGENVSPERKRIKAVLHQLRRDLDDNTPRRRLLHAIRSALIAADAAGSGLRRTGLTIQDWVAGVFDESRLWDGAMVRRSVINPRVEQVEGLTKQPFKWTDFQDHCADPSRVPERALLIAPCGSGKTLAAWRWIEEQAKRRVGHVLFLYPTRATATEGFRDYVSWAPEADAALMHGTSGFDLDGMFENPPEGDSRKGRTFGLTEAEQRLFALGYWDRRAFSATVDQFLAFLQYGYGPVCMLPVLADALVVIDEVHSFDNKMFSALKKFLTEFNVPVLCMTATLPTNRRDELVNECKLTPYPDGELPAELAKIARRERYQVRRAASRADAEAVVRAALAANKRVLWVVNQVKRAHAVVARFVKELPTDVRNEELSTSDGIPVYCYHSRFRLADRVSRHKGVMKALKETPGPALGVTTQVCEMSLDIDVDLLVTEYCPVTSLVQRMGRCNRAQQPRPLGRAGEVLVYEPEEDAPYTDVHLTGLPTFLDIIQDRKLSQDDLEQAMKDKRVDPPPSPGDSLCSFLESGPYAVGGEEDFRDSEEFNQPCVLPTDVGSYLKADPDQRPGYVLPVPRRYARDRDNENPAHAKLPRHLNVPRGGQYHAAVGYCDKALTEWGAE